MFLACHIEILLPLQIQLLSPALYPHSHQLICPTHLLTLTLCLFLDASKSLPNRPVFGRYKNFFPAELFELPWMPWLTMEYSSSQWKTLTKYWRSEQRDTNTCVDVTTWRHVVAPREILTQNCSRMNWRKRDIWNFWDGDQWAQSHVFWGIQTFLQGPIHLQRYFHWNITLQSAAHCILITRTTPELMEVQWF